MTLLKPKPQTAFARLGNHLALLHQKQEHVDYWRQYWSEEKRVSLLERGAEGDLGEFEELFLKYLPKDQLILEAGCGSGHIVAALAHRGYQVAGIDYEPDVVAFLNRGFPQLSILEGNILQLPYKGGDIGAYISVGVVEHFQGGPSAALKEARRVADNKGVLLISVPFLNPLRARQLRHLEQSTGYSADLSFHQYYYSIREFDAELQSAGLSSFVHFPYACEAFLSREHPVFARFWQSPLARAKVKSVLRQWMCRLPHRLRLRYAHMMMFVCRPL